MHDIINSPITWIVIAALSEIVALTPLKENSVVEIVFGFVNKMKPKKDSWIVCQTKRSLHVLAVFLYPIFLPLLYDETV